MASGEAADEVLGLLPEHAALIAASAISSEVASARGYRSATSEKELADLGFSKAQRLPGLVFPVRDVNGSIAFYQLRPDQPRLAKNGKAIKYETPYGAALVVDVPPAARGDIKDPATALYITEGARKADSAVSRGLCCVSLNGVYGWRGTNKKTGKTVLACWESIALNGRPVYICFDSDVTTKPEVAEALGRLRKFLESKGARVTIITLPAGPGGCKVGLDDFFAAGHGVEELPASRPAPAVLEEYEADADAAKLATTDPATKAFIVVDTKGLAETTDQAWAALLAANSPPVLYRQGDVLVRVAKDTKTGGPCLRVFNHHRMRLRLARVAEWVRSGKGGLKPVFPPTAVVDALLADDDAALPVLRRIVSVPVFAPDGRLLDALGYDGPSGILYLPAEGLNLPAVPEVPSEVDVVKARELVLEVFCDFKFVGAADRTAAVALLLTAFARGLVDGQVPMFMVEKPTPGTGASLLMDCIGQVVFGHVMEKIPEAGSEEEWRKRITASLLLSPPYVVLDNLRQKLQSGSLSGAITSGIWRDRELGVSRMVTLQVECIWVGTANNPKVSKEMSRRIVPCRMDAKVERPWERTGFKHDPILGWITEHRGELIWSCLVLIRHWLAAGRRPGPARLGSFTEWAQALSGILEAVGIPGLLTNVADFYQRADDETAPIRAFLAAWWKCHGTEPHQAKDLLPLALEADVDVGWKTEHAQKIKLGLLLKTERDRRYRLAPDLEVCISGKEDSHDKVYRWQLTAVTDAPGAPDTRDTPLDNSAGDNALRSERGAAWCFSPAGEREQVTQSVGAEAGDAEIGSAGGPSNTPRQPALPATVNPDDPMNDLEPKLEEVL
jgi:hypothetical protein